jgi:hypothetical protein
MKRVDAVRLAAVAAVICLIVTVAAPAGLARTSQPHATGAATASCLSKDGVTASSQKGGWGEEGDEVAPFSPTIFAELAFMHTAASAAHLTSVWSKMNKTVGMYASEYALFNVAVAWNQKPSASEKAVVATCINAAAGAS